MLGLARRRRRRGNTRLYAAGIVVASLLLLGWWVGRKEAAHPRLAQSQQVPTEAGDSGDAEILREVTLEEVKAARERASSVSEQATEHKLPPRIDALKAMQRLWEEGSPKDPVLVQRRGRVRDAFLHVWAGYSKYAFGHDEVRPVSNETNDSWGGFGVTIVDALDTIFLMNIPEAWNRSLEHIRKIDWVVDRDLPVFEVTIRHIGGLLAAYTLSEEKVLLDQATRLADVLLPAFETPTGIPYHKLNPRTRKGSNPQWTRSSSMLSEFGSMQLEWKYLSHLTGKAVYREKVQMAMDMIYKIHKSALQQTAAHVAVPGLWPVLMDPLTGKFTSLEVRVGGLGDSFYEYLLKQWLLTRKAEPRYAELFMDSMHAIRTHLSFNRTINGKPHIYLGSKAPSGDVAKTMEHLSCFLPGALFLGAVNDVGEAAGAASGSDSAFLVDFATGVLNACVKMYNDSVTGLAPEEIFFEGDIEVKQSKYVLRPEVIESLFIAFRVTHDSTHREMAWAIFEAIERRCKTPTAYSGITDVNAEKDNWNNSMQSFFLAETLKYLFLIFSSDNLVRLNEFVFNTEAHPFRMIPV